jgi:phosphinothricin acetyltransferase
VIVRPAEPGDAAGIAALHNAVIADPVRVITFTTALRTAAEVAALIDAGQPHWVGAQDGRVLGFATCFAFRKGPGYARTREHTILLAPEAQGRGLGRRLMAALEAGAAAEGVHSLFAGVSGENAAGVAFHAALGFAVAARLSEVGWKHGRWHDLVLMQKFLSAPGHAG